MSSTHFIATADRILVEEPSRKDRQINGLHVPETVAGIDGLVVSKIVGIGELVPERIGRGQIEIKVGMKVKHKAEAGQTLEDNGNWYRLLRYHSEVLAVLPEEEGK